MRAHGAIVTLLGALLAGCACGESHELRDASSSEDASRGLDAASPDAPFAADAPGDAPSIDATCARPTGIDVSGLGANCRETGTCAVGLTCLDHSGALLDRFCGIPCEADDGGACACPEGLVCGERVDKAGTHRECARP